MKRENQYDDDGGTERKTTIYIHPKVEYAGAVDIAGRILSDPHVAEALNWAMEVAQGLV